MHGMELVALVADRSIGGDTETASDSILSAEPCRATAVLSLPPTRWSSLAFLESHTSYEWYLML